MTTSNNNRTNRASSGPFPSNNPYHAVALQILKKDIQQMEYEWNEKPMCDPFSNNAICSAASRVIRQRVGRPKVFIDGPNAFIRIDKSDFQLGQQLSKWFDQANRGLIVKPIHSMLWLPRNLVSTRLLKTAFTRKQLIY